MGTALSSNLSISANFFEKSRFPVLDKRFVSSRISIFFLNSKIPDSAILFVHAISAIRSEAASKHAFHWPVTRRLNTPIMRPSRREIKLFLNQILRNSLSPSSKECQTNRIFHGGEPRGSRLTAVLITRASLSARSSARY